MVLEARYKAKEVGYSLVGEDIKENSNVIGYNINPEQTKDKFYEINANNQTTTGMATVIPGVNAPKLIASTSILGGSNVHYNELVMTSSTGFPAGDFTYFNSVTVVEGSDISLNPSYPSRLYLSPGVYIIYGVISVGTNRTIFVSEFYNGTWFYRYDSPSAISEWSDVTIIKSDGGYFQIGMNPDGNANNASCTLRLLKLG